MCTLWKANTPAEIAYACSCTHACMGEEKLKERKGWRDLQRERNSDSWRNTDAKKEKQRKLEATGGQQLNQYTQRQVDKQSGLRERMWADRQRRVQIERRTDVQADKARNTERMRLRRQKARRWTDGRMKVMRERNETLTHRNTVRTRN